MLLRAARSKSPILLFFLTLIVIAMWWSSFNASDLSRFHFEQVQMPLYRLTMGWIGQEVFVNTLVAFIILIIQGLIILRFNQQYIFITTQTYLHPIFYFLIASSFIQLQQYHPALPAGLFILLMMDQLFGSYRKRYILNRLFLAGLFAGVATLFYVQAVYFILLIWVALVILRAFSLREWFVPILGFAFPMAFLAGYYFYADHTTLQGLWKLIVSCYGQNETVTYYGWSYYLFYGFLAIWWLMASFSMLRKMHKLKIYIRKYHEILWWFFIGSVAIFVLRKEVSVEMLYFTALPLSFLLADHIHGLRSRTFGNILLLIFIALLGLIQYMN